MLKNKFSYKLLSVFFFFFFPLTSVWRIEKKVWLTAWSVEVQPLTLRTLVSGKNIAHNGSKLTCNIKSHSGYVPKHATSQGGGVRGGGQVMTYWVSSTLNNNNNNSKEKHNRQIQNWSKSCLCVDCINVTSVRKADSNTRSERLREREREVISKTWGKERRWKEF